MYIYTRIYHKTNVGEKVFGVRNKTQPFQTEFTRGDHCSGTPLSWEIFDFLSVFCQILFALFFHVIFKLARVFELLEFVHQLNILLFPLGHKLWPLALGGQFPVPFLLFLFALLPLVELGLLPRLVLAPLNQVLDLPSGLLVETIVILKIQSVGRSLGVRQYPTLSPRAARRALSALFTASRLWILKMLEDLQSTEFAGIQHGWVQTTKFRLRYCLLLNRGQVSTILAGQFLETFSETTISPASGDRFALLLLFRTQTIKWLHRTAVALKTFFPCLNNDVSATCGRKPVEVSSTILPLPSIVPLDLSALCFWYLARICRNPWRPWRQIRHRVSRIWDRVSESSGHLSNQPHP